MTKKNKIIVAVSLLVALIGYQIFKSIKDSYVGTSDEFFERNPHLTKPVSKLPIEVASPRQSQDFQSGDFQLKKNDQYKIDFQFETELSSQKQPTQKIQYQAVATITSLGILKGSLQLLVDFVFANNKTMESLTSQTKTELGIKSIVVDPSKKQKNPYTTEKDQGLARLALVKMDPRGILDEISVSNKNVTLDSLELKLILLESFFKKIAPIQAGTRVDQVPDLEGKPYQLKYVTTEQGTDELKINATAFYKSELGKSAAKTAASGMQSLKNLSLESVQDQSFDWTWSKSEQRPVDQKSKADIRMNYMGESVTQFLTQTKAKWNKLPSATADPEKIGALTTTFKILALRKQFASKRKLNLADDKSKKKQKNFADILKQFDKNHFSKLNENELNQFFIDLTNEVKANPELIKSIKVMTATTEPNSRQRSMLLGALGAEGSPEAQRILIDVYNRPDATKDEKIKILTEFALPPQALTVETKDFLKKEFTKDNPLNSDFAGTAGLALGSSISKDGDPNTVQFIRKQWDESADSDFAKERKSYLLSVMGNSKSDAFLPQVEKAANSSDESLRKAATNSVRFSQDPTSRDILFGMLNDSSAEVRAMAAESLRYQPFDDRTKNALKTCAVTDNNVGVKLGCYRVLGYNIGDQDVKDFISGRANSEADDQIKRTIDESLKMKEAK